MSTHDIEAPYYRLAELLYSLGWRPNCDAQYTNLRDNLHLVTAITHPATSRKMRDEFAGRAMAAQMQAASISVEKLVSDKTAREVLARDAYRVADAMLQARAQ